MEGKVDVPPEAAPRPEREPPRPDRGEGGDEGSLDDGDRAASPERGAAGRVTE